MGSREGLFIERQAARRNEMNILPDSILIVDDEQMNLDMLSRRLRRSGFSVEVAMSGAAALEMVLLQTFDLILLDQMMPEISGAEVLRRLRADFTAAVLPIIMVTAVAESEKIAEALAAGANDYITKPIDFKVALARIQSQLERKHAEDVLLLSEERYTLAARASQVGLWDWNLITGQMYLSPQWKQMLGLEQGQIEGGIDSWYSRILAQDRAEVMAAVDRHVQGHNDVLQCGYRILHADGSVRWMSSRGIATRDQQGNAIRLAGTQHDVTAEKTQDALTGMPNRLLLLAELERVLATAPAAPKAASHALLFLDLDGFKAINDRLGHLAGDELLKGIARRLLRLIREFDMRGESRAVAARMGGDEFAILLKAGTTRESVEIFAADIQRAMNVPFDLHGHTVHCAFSIGVALASPSHSQPEEILRDADIAMYTAKRQGRGGISIFDEKMHAAASQQLDLEHDIRLAAQRDELEVFYQPKVDLRSGVTYGVEALLRWNHPRFGLLQPGTFIQLAEETGAIVEIGRWVLDNACRQVRAWHDVFSSQPPLELSVNLSPREFIQQDLVEGIRQTLVATNFPPSSLHLEITEGVFVGDFAAARFTLNKLKALGVYLDLDDFGTGYSSLQYLRELPFDLLKIDRYFVKSLDPEQPSSGELLQTMLSMTQKLGMEAVAEGVETHEHIIKLRELGFSLGQGFYYSRPIPSDAMEAFLSKGPDAISSLYSFPADSIDATADLVIAGAA
jgi:diguanylate cyclase (GGDEF)-like protein/PAS domain S-box-containing protein